MSPVPTAVAFALLVGAGALVALPSPVQPPALLALVFVPFALALVIPRVPQSVALPALLVLPTALLGAQFGGEELQMLVHGLHIQGWTLLMDTVFGLAAAYVLARGDWRRGLAGFVPFLLAVGLRDQVAMLGMQFLLPGVLVWLVTALLPFTAAEPGVGVGHALAQAVRRIPEAPLAWVVTIGGLLGSALAGMAVFYLAAADPAAAMFDPHTASLEVRVVANVVSYGAYGVTLLLGAELYHRAIRR